MGRKKIAIDIDDVLAATTEALIQEVNEKRGVNLTESHYRIDAEYWGYYESVWAHHKIDDTNLTRDFHDGLAVDQSRVVPIAGSINVLRHLASRYDLSLVTSRPDAMRQATDIWLDRHFNDIPFANIVFLNFGARAKQTKGQACSNIGAAWLIDDNVEHCQSALQQGTQPILFGAYGWQGNVPSEMQRSKTWNQVREYFDNV